MLLLDAIFLQEHMKKSHHYFPSPFFSLLKAYIFTFGKAKENWAR